jgi:hypothetical protein
VEFVPELGGDDPMIPIAMNGSADELFRQMIAITLGGVDQVDPALPGGIEHAIDFILGKILPPFTTELPGSHADDGDFQTGLAQVTIFHGGNLPATTDPAHSKLLSTDEINSDAFFATDENQMHTDNSIIVNAVKIELNKCPYPLLYIFSSSVSICIFICG